MSPAEAGATSVTVTTTYHPPLGRLGANLDRTVLAGLADTTMTALVRAVITKLTVLADADRLGNNGRER